MSKVLTSVNVCVWLAFFCSCSTLPVKQVAEPSFPANEYSFYSGDRDTVGDVWSKETILVEPKTGKEVTLLGMYHIADKVFYRYVQDKIDRSDVVLAEGVSGKSSLSVSSFFYAYMFALYERAAHWQRLASQGHELIIPPEKYVNADVKFEELEQHNSWRSSLIQTLLAPVFLLTVEPTLLCSDLSDALHLAESDENKRKRIASRRHFLFSTAADEDDTKQLENSLLPGVITPRNEKLLEVIQKQLTNDRIESILIPWGAAHLQDVEEALVRQNYVVKQKKWLKTISAKGALDEGLEFSHHRKVNIPYIYTYYKYPNNSEHNLLFQLFHLKDGEEFKAIEVGYGQIFSYQTVGESSYISLFPMLFGKPLFFDHINVNGETKTRLLLFIEI